MDVQTPRLPAHFSWSVDPPWLRVVLLAMSAVPAYLVFAVSLMAFSAGSVALLGWRPPERADMSIADLEWPRANSARYGVSTHVVLSAAVHG